MRETRYAREHERKIWELQQRAGCKLRGEEIVARDLEHDEQPERAAEIRKSVRRPRRPKLRTR